MTATRFQPVPTCEHPYPRGESCVSRVEPAEKTAPAGDLPAPSAVDRCDAVVAGELATIQMFWHGAPLSRVERLSLSSFVAHGHRVLLHVYDEPAGVPPGVSLCDASRVLPRDAVFRHARTGSLAPFADWFRCRVLFEQGGIWSDADVVCLRPWAFGQQVVYAWQDDERVCNAVLGLPAGHWLAEWMAGVCEKPNRVLPYDSPSLIAKKLVRRLLGTGGREALGFGEAGPRGLTRALRHFGMLELALPSWQFYPIHYSRWRSAFDGSLDAASAGLERSSALHLWHEMMRRAPGFDRDRSFPPGSLFEELCRRYLGDGGAGGGAA